MPVEHSSTRKHRDADEITPADLVSSEMQQLVMDNASSRISVTSFCHLELPPFFQADPRLWFAQVDLVFANHNIISDTSIGMSLHNYRAKRCAAFQISS